MARTIVEATRQEEAVLRKAEATTQQLHKTAQQLLAEARETRELAAKKRRLTAVVPLTKVSDDHVFRADQLSEIMNLLRSFQRELEKRSKKYASDKVNNSNLQHVTALLELGNSKDFPGFVKKFRSVSKDFPEHRIAFLTNKRRADGEVGAATVKKIENLITDIVSKQPPAKPLQFNRSEHDANGKDPFGLNKWDNEQREVASRKGSDPEIVGSENSDNSTYERSRSRSAYDERDEEVVDHSVGSVYEKSKSSQGLFQSGSLNIDQKIIGSGSFGTQAQGQFLVDIEKKLAIYLKHLEQNQQKALKQKEKTDPLLTDKINVVKSILVHVKHRDFSQFSAEWDKAKIIIEKHRPKTIGGIKMKFTAVLPFEGKNLVKEIEKARSKYKLDNSRITKKV